LARHCTEAGLIEKAAGFWGEAGQRSLERSALVEATAQFTQGLDLIARLPATPALRRDRIKPQVALITPLIHIKGYSAPETKAAAERARFLIEQAEKLGEPPEDPLLLFSVLYGFWYATLERSTAMRCATLPRSFWRLLKSKGRPYRSWLGTASWVLRRCTQEILWTAERISIRRWRFTIPTSIIRWRLGTVKTSECRSCRFVPLPCGCLAILKPH
jgi:hypothetical protein